MLRGFLIYDDDHKKESNPAEGDLYKRIEFGGRCFDIYYGYYEECDRLNPAIDPMPIYPDFIKEPQYSDKGFPFVTKMQDACSYYKGRETKEKDCAECRHYMQGEELLGVCTCYEKKLNTKEPTDFRGVQEETK